MPAAISGIPTLLQKHTIPVQWSKQLFLLAQRQLLLVHLVHRAVEVIVEVVVKIAVKAAVKAAAAAGGNLYFLEVAAVAALPVMTTHIIIF